MLLTSLVVPLGAVAQEQEEGQEQAGQDDDTARARALFDEGVAHVDAGEWEQAAEKFRQALELKDAPAVRYNLASALVSLEQWGEAAAMARAVVDDPEASPDLRQRSQALLDQIGQETGELTVAVHGATEGITIRLEDAEVPWGSVEHRFSLEPRGYTVVIERGGREIERREVSVQAGESTEVTVAVAPSPAEAAASAEQPGPAAPEGGGDDLVTDWRFWAVVGGAVILAIALAVVAAN